MLVDLTEEELLSLEMNIIHEINDLNCYKLKYPDKDISEQLNFAKSLASKLAKYREEKIKNT